VVKVRTGHVEQLPVSTRATNEGFIRRTIRAVLGHKRVREARGLLLGQFYASLAKCGDLACTGTTFTEDRDVPVVAIDPASADGAWQQVASALREAVS